MKRAVPVRTICLVAAMATVLGACSSSGGDNGASSTSGAGNPGASSAAAVTSGASSSSQKTLHIGMAVANNSLNFATEMMDGARQAAKDAGNVDLNIVGPPDTDGPAEEKLFQSLTATATDGIVLENLDPPIFTRPAAQAVAKGIKVVALDTAPTNGSNVNLYVGNDNYELGVMLAEQTIKRLPSNPSGNVVVGEPNPGTPVLDSRVQGIKDTFAKDAPNVKVLGAYQTYSDPNQNYSAWLALVHSHPALAYLGVGDADSYDLAKIKQDEHGKYLVAGTDVDAKTLEDVKAGLDFVTIDPEHFIKGYIAMWLLIQSDRGQTLPSGWFETPGLVVDSSNIDSIIAREKSPAAEYAYYKDQIQSLLAKTSANMKPLSDAR
jgi:ribose transport system substrate-binding protein